VEGETVLDDELALPWYRSVFSNVQDALFPKKLPPLVLTSKPVAVRDIWGFYDNKKNAPSVRLRSTWWRFALLIGGTLMVRNNVTTAKATGPVMPLLSDSDIPRCRLPRRKWAAEAAEAIATNWPRPKGGYRSLPWSRSLLRWFVVRNENPKLAVEPTVVVSSQIKLAMNNMPNLGDRWQRSRTDRSPTERVPAAASDQVRAGVSVRVKDPASVPVAAVALAARVPCGRGRLGTKADLPTRSRVFRRSAQGEVSGHSGVGAGRGPGRSSARHEGLSQPRAWPRRKKR